MKNLIILLIFFSFNKLISQEIVDVKEIYTENNLIYKSSDENLFTGIAQDKRRNGHLVYEEEYKNGIILSSNLYYNGKEKRIATKTIYNPNNPFVSSKEYSYDLKGEIFKTITYNADGIKILEKQFKNGKMTYSCQYNGEKKHGEELVYEQDGVTITCRTEYNRGKKIK